MVAVEPRARERAPGLTDTVTVVTVVGSAFLPFERVGALPPDPTTVALLAAAALALLLRRRWPVVVLAAMVAVFVLVAILGRMTPAAALPVTVAVFGVAHRTNRRTTVAAALSAIAVLVATILASLPLQVLDARIVQVVAVVAFAAAAGDGVRSRRAYTAAITERALRAELTKESEALRRVAEERLRIARDLHDVVAHQIAVVSLHAGVAEAVLRKRPEEAERSLATIKTAARSVLAEIGDLLAVLRTATPELPETVPGAGTAQVDDLVAQFTSTGMTVTRRADGPATRLPPAVDVVAYRVIQEALTNAHKHGSENRAHLLLDSRPEALTITVTNAVRSAPAAAILPGYGLTGMRERVESVRGTVETTLDAASGFRLRVRLPTGPAVPARPTPAAENGPRS